MFQDEPIFLAVFAGLSVLVIGLLVTVILLAKSLRTKNCTAREGAADTGERGRSPKRSSDEARPGEGAVHEPKIIAMAEEGSDEDLTKVGASPRSLPRLSVDREEEAESESSEPAMEESIARLLYDSDAEVDIEEPTGPNDIILVSAVGQTDRGITRRKNEDAYLIDTNRQIYAVADGMGGYAGGDIASRLAIQEVWNAMESPSTEVKGYEDRPRSGRELIAAVERANTAVYREAQAARELHGMGTTLVAARFSPKKQRMYVAHVGDSRCYRFRDGTLQMLTHDHTMASRGVEGPLAKNICRAVGIAKTVKVDLIVDKPLPNDVFLLCSDGLPKMVTDEHIRRILTSNEGALDRASAQLVLAANASGGRDNITVVLVRILEITKTMRTAAILKNQNRVEFGPS